MARGISWSSGDAYEAYVGRWSRLVAREFVAWLEARSSARWLDVGCGTGALIESILDEASPSTVHGVDPSEAHVEHAKDVLNDERVALSVGSAEETGLPEGSFDYVVSGLVLNFVRSHPAALDEMKRVAAPGGRVGAYVWDYSGGMELMRYFWDAATELDPRARELDEGRTFTICLPDPLISLWNEAGLRDVDLEAIVVPTVFQSFDDYWTPFLGGQGPAPGYATSLPEDDQDRLRDLLRERLPVEGDGSIHLRARAWAVSGLV